MVKNIVKCDQPSVQGAVRSGQYRLGKKAKLLLLLLFTVPQSLSTAVAQQPQTQAVQELFPVNAKYVQGFGPGYWPTAGSNLILNLAPGTAVCGNTARIYVGGTFTLTSNSTNYVYLDTTNSCIPAFNTTGFGSTTLPIAIVITSSASITSVTDVRTMFVSNGGTGSGSVTSVGLAMPSMFSISGSPVTTAGTLTAALAVQNANSFLAGPASGIATAPTFRALMGTDLPVPSATALGGVQSKTCSGGQFLNQISTAGAPSCGTPSGGGSSGLGNGTTVIDASLQAGTDLGAKLNGAIAACPAYGCIIDARGVSGAQNLAVNVSFSSAAQPITIWLAEMLTLTRATGKQILIGTNGRLMGQGKTSTIITGNDTSAAVAGIYAGGAPSDVDVENLEISNSGNGACIDLLIASAGALSSTIHDNSLNCATGIMLTGYWNRIWNNNFNQSPNAIFWAGTVLDTAGSGEPNSNHIYDNVYGGGGMGTGDFVRNGYSNKYDGSQDYEGTNLAVFDAAQAQQFHTGGDVENVYCNSRGRWTTSTVYGRGAVIYDSNGNCEIDVTPATSGYSAVSGSVAPTWPTVQGNTVADGGVTWEMYSGNGGESAFVVFNAGSMTNVLDGPVGQNPYIADLDYVVNGNTTNVINTTSNGAWGTSGTAPYSIDVGTSGLNFVDQGSGQPGLGQSVATLNLNQFNPQAGPYTIENGASLDIPVAGNMCSIYGYCGHLNLRLGTLYPTAGMSVQGPVSFNPLPNPAAPVIAVVGTAGTTTATYYLIAHVNGGVTLPSPGTTITNAPNTLTSSNYVVIKAPSMIGYGPDPWSNATWDILKGSTAASIDTNINLSPNGMSDQGGASTAYSVPVRNTTGDESHYGNEYFGGNVGVGTSNPVYPLHIVGGSPILLDLDGSNQYTSFTVNNTTGKQASVNLSQNGVQAWSFGTDFGGAGSSDFFLYQAAGLRNPLFVDTAGNVRLGGTSGYSGTQAMTILQGGNVGIGTPTPGQRLDVTGGYIRSDTGFCIAATCTTAFSSLSNPMTTPGDLMFGGAGGAFTRLPGNSSTTPQYLKSLGASGSATAPTLAQIQFSDITGTLSCGSMPALSGDTTSVGGSCATATKNVNGVSYGSAPSTNTVPVVTSAFTTTYEALPNAALANSGITLNGAAVSLGGSTQVPVYAPCAEGYSQFSSTDTFTNSTASEQVFSTKCTLPANYITSKRVLSITPTFDTTPTATVPTYLIKGKLCTVAGCASGTVVNFFVAPATAPTAGTISSGIIPMEIQGTAAPGSSVPVYSNGAGYLANVLMRNNQASAVNGVPTNGVLYLQFSITFGGTGSNNPITMTQLLVEGKN